MLWWGSYLLYRCTIWFGIWFGAMDKMNAKNRYYSNTGYNWTVCSKCGEYVSAADVTFSGTVVCRKCGHEMKSD